MTPRDDDEKRTGDPGPHTGGSDLGADWLMSQLDDTGAHSTIDGDSSPHEQEQQSSRGSRRRRFRRRSEQTDAAESGAAADETAPTHAFDEAADRSTSRQTPPSRTKDGIFTWGLTPNSDVDPLVAGTEAESGTTPPSPGHGADAVSGSAADGDAGEPTQAFDPFADHEPDPVAPEQAAADAVFAQPGAYDRLYDEATLSSLDDDDDDDEEDAADEPSAAGLPVPKPAVTDAPDAVIPPPVGASDVDGAPSGENAFFPEDTEFADDEERAEAEEIAEEAGVPLEAESTTSPDLGILDLFGASRRERTPGPGQGAEDTGPITPEPAALTGAGDAERTSGESETSARLRALFESTATAPNAVQQPPPAPVSPPRSPARGSGGSGGSGRSGGSRGSGGGSRGRSPLVLAGIVVAAVVVLGGLFWAGTLIPGMVSASQPQASDTSTPTPTPSLPAEGTLPAGTYAWDQLRGGECLTDYSSPWAEEFTVVACDEEHDAQLLAVDTMGDENAAFPGEDDLASQIYLLCSDPSVIDLSAAGEYGDVQVQGSYPVTEEQWNDGQRSYYCFADRSSGDPLSGTLVPDQ